MRPVGYALATGGAGTLITMGLAPMVELQPSGSFQLLAAGGWGTWFGAWTGELLDVSADEQWLLTLGAGDAALLGAAAAQAAGWKPGWREVGLINGMGTIGAATGGLVGVIALYDEDNWDPMIASTLAGSGAGLIAGAVLAAGGDEPSSGAMMLPTGRGTAVLPGATVRPWTDENGDPGVFVELRLDETRR